VPPAATIFLAIPEGRKTVSLITGIKEEEKQIPRPIPKKNAKLVG